MPETGPPSSPSSRRRSLASIQFIAAGGCGGSTLLKQGGDRDGQDPMCLFRVYSQRKKDTTHGGADNYMPDTGLPQTTGGGFHTRGKHGLVIIHIVVVLHVVVADDDDGVVCVDFRLLLFSATPQDLGRLSGGLKRVLSFSGVVAY